MKILMINLFMLAAFSGGAWAQSLDKLAGKLSAGLKDRPAIKLAVLEFPYTGARPRKAPSSCRSGSLPPSRRTRK